jgi:hypothetical protein
MTSMQYEVQQIFISSHTNSAIYFGIRKSFGTGYTYYILYSCKTDGMLGVAGCEWVLQHVHGVGL